TAIKTPVNFIVHSLDEVNNALAQGQYFFSDITREGIVLYELPGHPLAEPKPLTPEEAYETAKGHFDQWLESAGNYLTLSQDAIQRDMLNEAAFLLHQSAERLYHCVLLVLTNYSPSTHNLKFLRSLAESK